MIDHIFVVMLENRSFDHMLGSSQIEGTDAVSGKPTRIEGLAGTESNPSPNGGTVGVSLPADFRIDSDPGHEFPDVREQLCGEGGLFSSPTPSPGSVDQTINNSGFVSNFAAKYPNADWGIVMKCFPPERLPILTALAKEFAVCDHWFSSMPGPTWPNRFFLHAATAGGLDHSPSLPKEIASSAGDAYSFDNGTIYDLLDSARLDWTIYFGDEFPQSLHMKGMVENFAKGKFQPFIRFKDDLQATDFTKSYVFIEPDWHPFTQFRWGNSQHPVDDVTRGEQLLKEVYEAIRGSPVWEKSMLIVTYDEHGGFFDHVRPPTTVSPGDSTTDPDSNKYGFDFQQLGVRVPAIIVSPYIDRGVIDHQVYEHSSVLATVEKQFGLKNLTRRDQQSTPLSRLLTLAEPRTDAPVSLPPPANSGLSLGAESESIAGMESFFDRLLTEIDARTPKPPDPSLAGFTHVALLRKLSASTPGERDKIISEALRVQSEADVLRYLGSARKQFLA